MASSTKVRNTFVSDDSVAYSVFGAAHQQVIQPTIATLESGLIGTPNPKWRQIISDGKDATTALTAYRRSVSVTPGNCVIQSTYNGGWTGAETYCGIGLSTGGGTIFSLPRKGEAGYFFPQQIIDDCVAKARSKVFSDIAEREHSFHAQTFLYELRRTIDELRHPFTGMRNIIERFSAVQKKVSLKSVKYTAKDLADLWLEFRFGMLPLLGDVSDLIKQFDQKAQDGASTLYKKKGYAEHSTSTTVQGNPYSSSHAYVIDYNWKYRATCYESGGLLAETQERLTGLASINDALTDFFELPNTIWEEIPWSFLIDYFVNAGNLIEAVTTGTSKLRYNSESVVLSTEYQMNSRAPIVTNSKYISILSFQPKIVVARLNEVTRTGGGLAIPPLTVSIPGSSIRLANMVALLVSNLKF